MGDSIAGMDVFVDDTDQRIVYGGGAWKSVKNIDITSPPKDSLASNPLFGTFHTFNATASATGQPTPSFTLAFNFTGIQFKAMFHMSSTLGIKSCSVDNNKQTISSRDSLNEKVSCNNGNKPLSPGPHSLVITFDPDPATPIQFDGIIYTPNDPSKPVPDSNIITYFNTANPDISHLGFGGMSNVDMVIANGFSMGIYVDFKYSTDSVDPAQLSYTVDGSQDPVHFTVTNPCNKKNSTISSQLLIQTPLSSRNQSIFHLTYYNASEPSAVNQTKFTVRFMIVQNATTPNVQLPVFPTLTSSISSSISATSLTTPLPRTIHVNSHRIAIVVGFSLAIIALITACLLFYLWRRRNAKAAKEQLDNNSIWPRPYRNGLLRHPIDPQGGQWKQLQPTRDGSYIECTKMEERSRENMNLARRHRCKSKLLTYRRLMKTSRIGERRDICLPLPACSMMVQEKERRVKAVNGRCRRGSLDVGYGLL